MLTKQECRFLLRLWWPALVGGTTGATLGVIANGHQWTAGLLYLLLIILILIPASIYVIRRERQRGADIVRQQ